MHEDPTRRMPARPPPEEPLRGGASTGIRVLLGILVAAVVGLGVALAVVASDDGGEHTTSTASVPTTAAPTTTTTTQPTTTTTTQPTTTTTTETTTETTTVPGESGGTPSP
jgi:eukaryotic-like serine/threonine-protein kinase